MTRSIDIATLKTGPVVVRNAVKTATGYADTMRAQGKPLSEINVFPQTYVRLANAARRSAKVGSDVNIHLHYRGIRRVHAPHEPGPRALHEGARTCRARGYDRAREGSGVMATFRVWREGVAA